MARLTFAGPDTLDAQGRKVYDEVVGGKRGKMPAPLVSWILNPEAARRALHLGELMRFDTTLSLAVTELVILVCARHWTAHACWKAHKVYAVNAGVPEAGVAEIAAGRVARFEDPQFDVAYRVADTLMRNRQLPSALYDEAVAMFGERGLSEITIVLGYYCMAGLALNTFELGLPENLAPELVPLAH